jgi:hypothetical protein
MIEEIGSPIRRGRGGGAEKVAVLHPCRRWFTPFPVGISTFRGEGTQNLTGQTSGSEAPSQVSGFPSGPGDNGSSSAPPAGPPDGSSSSPPSDPLADGLRRIQGPAGESLPQRAQGRGSFSEEYKERQWGFCRWFRRIRLEQCQPQGSNLA